MSVASYRIKKKLKEDVFALPKKFISKLAEAGEAEIKIFLALASLDRGDDYLDESELLSLSSEYGVGEEDFAEGLAFLRGAGLIEKPSRKTAEKKEEKKSVPARPAYTAKELAKEAESSEFKELVEYASRRLQKTLGPSDIHTLYSFHDFLCMPYEVIMLAIEHCASEGKGSLRYVEKLLISFADSEINTYDKAEEYIMRRKKYLSFEGKIRGLLGLGERTLTSKEKNFVSEWQEWSIPFDMIKLAYDKTVEKTGKVSMSYMHRIFESWRASGFKSVDEVTRGDVKPKDSSESFDLDEFFKAAVEKDMKR